MDEPKITTTDTILLSDYTKSILLQLADMNSSHIFSGGEVIDVSETASFFAFLYERVRSAVEFSEEHLIRRFAISRILKRRLSVNPQGQGEGLNVVRELLWGRYLAEGSVTKKDADGVQAIVDISLALQREIIEKGSSRASARLTEFIVDLASCEIEEHLQKKLTLIHQAQVFFLYQTTHRKVIIEDLEENKKNQYYFTACEAAYLKNDDAFIRYHLFALQHGTLAQMSPKKMTYIALNFRIIFTEIGAIINNPHRERLIRFVKKQLPPFRIFFEIVQADLHARITLSSFKKLLERTNKVCDEKYRETGQKLRIAAIRSIIYIFATKMLLVLILEIPLTRLFYGELHLLPLTINTISPPVLMGIIVTFINPPRATNTRRIYERIIHIINADNAFERRLELTIGAHKRLRRPVLWAIFTLFYTILFISTFVIIYLVLDYLHFTIISKAIFIFFISVVTFFGYRIRQIAKEYTMSIQETLLSPLVDAMALPILAVGKVLSNELARLNILMYFFDVLIEAPFKLIVEIVEEWVTYARQRKDEIA